jgi:predicted metalloenzyme YecM
MEFPQGAGEGAVPEGTMLARQTAALPVLKRFFCNIDETEVQVECTDDIGQIIRRQVLDNTGKSLSPVCVNGRVVVFVINIKRPRSCVASS